MPRQHLKNTKEFWSENEAKRANKHANKRIIYWPPFWNKVYRLDDGIIAEESQLHKCWFPNDVFLGVADWGTKPYESDLVLKGIDPGNMVAMRESFQERLVTSWALTIYTIHSGGNFRCKYSVQQLFQTQNGKIRKCISINWKVQKEKKECLD